MKCSGGRSQRGFTVHEMLLVVAILIVLLAVSIVGLVSYSRRLQLAELDNSAREIFLAAQNRAILLSGGQRLEGLVAEPDGSNRIDHVEVLPGAEETTQISVYYIYCKDDNIGELLPTESIDPALWDGDFYITYEPESGSVVDVFYAEKPLPVEGDFPAFYATWRGASKEQRMDSDPMIGYYGGEAAESGTAISLRTPVINIENGDTLKAEVTYWLPRSLAMTAEADHVALEVELTYGAHTVTLPQSSDNREQESSVAYIAYTYTWTLDTLVGTKFRDLFAKELSLTCGDDFTITAEVSYDGTLEVNGARKTATDNSLFDTGSGGETAYIACLRHLQNLDATHSSVAGKTAAIQRNDIQKVEDYTFDPIENDELLTYDGQEKTIENITIEASGTVGLFGSFGGNESKEKTLTGIRLVNTTVTGGVSSVGALVGEGTNLTLTNCQVYWENQSDEYTNLRYLLGDNASGFQYQVIGNGYVGGLAGVLTNSTIESCSASTLASGDTVGGLVGQGSGLTITGAYAASYLSGNHTAGLVGALTGSTSIDSSYAVGYLATKNGGTAAGLCLGNQANVNRSYSAMLFTVGETVKNYPLCASGTYDTHTYYLDSDLFNFGGTDKSYAKAYDDLVNPALWDSLFGAGTFTAKTTTQSHPYNLQTTLSLTNYTYPGLAELDHWGDWGAQFQNGSLVYYEKYGDNDYGFSGGGVNHLQERLVVEDGYAMAYRGTESGSAIDITLSIVYQTSNTQQSPWENTYTSDNMYKVEGVANAAGREEDYYLLPLPEDIVNSEYAAADFYQKITVKKTTDDAEKSYYYNPHFADAILPYDEATDLSQLTPQLRVSVRSPRHLYNLSRFSAYYASTHQYRFLQQLDLDYDTYTGYGLFQDKWAQSPIGIRANQPFRGSYYGNCHTISGVVLEDEAYQYVGLFGYTTGVIQDVVYHMTTPMTIERNGSSVTVYAGGLVGYNGGTVDNCAVDNVELTAHCYEYSTAYLGGLAGINAGVIRDSAAEVADLSVNTSFSNAYTGGFIGRNASGGAIDRCYAVGSVSASRARHGTVYACGFAGRNNAAVSRSYAAVRLTVSGDAVSFGFCPDSTTNCVYLNDGNFTYRDAHYAAQYTDVHAEPVTWAELTGQVSSEAIKALGMNKVAGGNSYPYPTAVIDGQSQPVHYGQWPDAMELGTMGVYYWEKMEIGSAVSYHISAISQADGQTVERSTLSTAHGDGGVVTEYGYGYFHAGETAPTLTSTGIGYSNSNGFNFNPQLENSAVNEALYDLMGGRYTFHSFNTWGTQKDSEGLYQVSGGDEKQPPNGTWTLNNTFKVYLNPFFANAMSITVEELPGTQDNPYEVRSIDQLQFINWNKNAQNTVRRMDIYNKEYFPYLCYGSSGNWTLRPYHWEQTHDLEGETDVTYTPIAAVYDETSNSTGDLFGWFGGTYDGNDYVIADVNIAPLSASSKDATSCVGLFGAVFNGTLKNIVLYSESGTAKVEGSNSDQSRWYAIGGLAGLAGSNRGSAVVNCTVAGYQIIDSHQSTSQGGWGGTGLGGLIGVSDMSLTNCTAVTNITLTSKDNDNVRVGGLVGSCQGSISNCYAGGSIQVDRKASTPDDRGMYIGGIVGGIYLKPQTVGGRVNVTVGQSGQYLQNTLKNCYTYVELPDVTDNGHIKGLYAVGGSGELNVAGTADGNADHGYTNYENNYYLGSVVLQNNNNNIPIKRNDLNKVASLSYAKMADTNSDDGLLKLLNKNGGGFHTVTTETATGEPLSGRYSFGNDASLLGTDYPFPTILTQSSDVAKDGIANVHYGDWPIEGIRRADGALPVNLDLFADYQEGKGAVWEETLELSGGVSGGQWSAKSDDEKVATVKIDENGNLTITAQSAGNTVVTVSYGDKPYTLQIEVNVTANLRMTTTNDGAVTAFTDATVATPLQLTDQSGAELLGTLPKDIKLTELSVEFDHDYFTTATLSNEVDTGLLLTADGKTANADKTNIGSTQMTASYTFAYLGTKYDATAVLSLNLVEPVIEVKPMNFVFDGEPEQTTKYTGSEDGQFVLKLHAEGQEEKLEQLQLTAYEPVALEFKDVAWVQWAKDDTGAEQVGTLSITAYAQPLYPAAATVRVQYQFQYGGNTYTLWRDLPIELTEPKSEEPTTPPDEPAEGEVQP